jgi:hypothetical protein
VGATTTLATAGGCTVTATEAETLLGAVAVTWALPAFTAEARPVEFTVLTVELLDDQAKRTPLTRLPLASTAVAVNCCV